MNARPADPRQQPGVCPECKGRVWGSVDMGGDYDRLCFCTGQQPAQSSQPNWLCIHGYHHLPETMRANCGCKKPAQPGSGEATLVRYGLQWNGPREFVSTPMPDGYWTPWHIAHEALTAAQQREAELREALRTYGWHKPECDYMQEELPCTCGFMDAVKEPS